MELKKGANSYSLREPQAIDKERRKRLFDIHDRKRDGFPACRPPPSVGTGAGRGCLATTMEGNARWMRI